MNRIQAIAIIASLAIHASLIGTMRGYKWTNRVVPIPQIQKKEEVAIEFVDVPDTAKESKVKKDSKVISDKTVEAKDRLKEKIKDGKAKAKVLDKSKQIAKKSAESVNSVPPQPQPQPQPKMPESMGPNKIEQPEMPQVPAQQPSKVEYDIVNIPEVSESIFNAPEEGPLSFEVQAHKIGPYFKQIKRSIERYWLSYLVFKYQNRAPQASEAVVRFKILPSGEVANVTVLEFYGDTLFRDFSVASIVNTAPFPPLPSDLKEELKKEGGLDIVFTFTYK